MFIALQEPIRREILVGERLLLACPRWRHEAAVAPDGRLSFPTGERIVAVRRTLAEFRAAHPRLTSVRRVPGRNAGFPILPSGRVLRVADDTPLLDALRGLPPLASVAVISAEDAATTVPRTEFGRRRLAPGDALIFGKEATVARVTILGGVLRPGVFEAADAPTLAALIAKAGGLASRALSERILIERGGKPLGPYALAHDGGTPIEPGDAVRVPVTNTAAYVSIAGAVRKPGLYEVLPEMTVAHAIQAAGGLTLPEGSLLVSLRSITDAKRKSVKGKATDLGKFPILKGGDLLEIAPPPPRPQ